MEKNFVILILLLLASPHPGSSQADLNEELSYGVHINYPPGSISREKLQEARTLIDLNKFYRSSWVREYISVELLTSRKGRVEKAMSKNDTLTQEQKEILNRADPGAGISVRINYMPDNTLTHNDPKEINFTFTVDPENEAKYPGGQQQLKKYLKGNLIDKVSDAGFKKYQLAAVKFTIDEEGLVTNPHVFWTSEDKKTDELLLVTICNMPCWKPAEYANGIKVKQEFVLTVGDMESCVVNLLNIRQY